MIVGIAGKKQSGKSTVASKLCEHGFTEMSLANPVKSAAHVILNHLGLSWADICVAEADKEAVIEPLGHSYRAMLQTLGTDWGRALNPDIWLNCAEHKLLKLSGGNVVVSDVRFENEAAFIRAHGGLIVHLVRHSSAVDAHASEAGIIVQHGDVVVSNNGSLEGLFNRVFMAVNNHAELEE